MIEFRVLGLLALHPTGGDAPAAALTQPKRLALLLYLALVEPAGAQSRESLMALLWPEADDESARHSLRNALYGLRQALGEDAIDSRGEGYVGLNPEAVRCDALEVRRLLGEEEWEEALSTWHGDLAPGFHVAGAPEFERWLDERRASFRRAITSAAWHRVDQLEQGGDGGVVPAARRAWALDPADESGARRLLRLLDAKVGKAAALRAYDDLVDHLLREFETDPSPETRALAEQLKARIEIPANPAAPWSRAPDSSPDHQAPVANIAPASSAEPNHVPWRRVLVVAVLLIMGGISLLALRPDGSAARRRGADPVGMSETEGTLRLPARYREDTAVYAAYLRALTMRFRNNPIGSRDAFAALVEQQPLYAPGYSGLAHAYLFLVFNSLTPPAEGLPKAEAAAEKSIALDSTLASSYLALAMVEMVWRWNSRSAGELIDRAIAMDPQDPEAHIIRSNWFRWRAEADSAVTEAQVAHQLDPLDAGLSIRVAKCLLFARRYAEAEAKYRQTIRDYPVQGGSYVGLSELYSAMGRPLDALEMFRTATELSGDSAALAQLPTATSDSEAARVFADLSRQELRNYADSVRAGDWVPPHEFAFAYAILKDTNQVLRWLDSMVVSHDPMGQNVLLNPGFDFLRGDPRYRAWEKNLPWRK